MERLQAFLLLFYVFIFCAVYASRGIRSWWLVRMLAAAHATICTGPCIYIRRAVHLYYLQPTLQRYNYNNYNYKSNI